MVKQSEVFGAVRPHFKILGGLRGVAALAVVIFHFLEVSCLIITTVL